MKLSNHCVLLSWQMVWGRHCGCFVGAYFHSLQRENLCKRRKGLLVKAAHFKLGMEPALIRHHSTVCPCWLFHSSGGKVKISPVYRTMKPVKTSSLSSVLMKGWAAARCAFPSHMPVIKVSLSGLERLFTFLLCILQRDYWLFQKSRFITHWINYLTGVWKALGWGTSQIPISDPF